MDPPENISLTNRVYRCSSCYDAYAPDCRCCIVYLFLQRASRKKENSHVHIPTVTENKNTVV